MVGIAVLSVVALSIRIRTIADFAAALATAIWVGIFVSSPGKYKRLMPLATIFGILALVSGTRVVFWNGMPKNDFLQFYVGAGTVGAHDFYGTAAAQATRESLSQEQFPMAFVRLPFYAWLLHPLTWLSYHAAYVIWQSLSAASFIAAVLLRRSRRLAVAVASAWSIPLAVAWVRGQDIGFVLLALTLAMFLLETGWPGAGGVVISFCAIKWNLFLMLPMFLLRFRSARFLSGFFIGTLIIVLISFAVAGVSWPAEYLRLLQKPELSPHIDGMPTLSGLFSGISQHFYFVTTYALATIGVATLNWFVVFRTASREYAMAATCISGLLVTPHAYPYDCALLIPFLVALGFKTHSLPVRYLATLVLMPVFSLLLWSHTWHTFSQCALLALLLAMALEQKRNTKSSVRVDGGNLKCSRAVHIRD
jgi:hypothetical protein